MNKQVKKGREFIFKMLNREIEKKRLDISIEFIPSLIVSSAVGAFIGCIIAKLF